MKRPRDGRSRGPHMANSGPTCQGLVGAPSLVLFISGRVLIIKNPEILERKVNDDIRFIDRSYNKAI